MIDIALTEDKGTNTRIAHRLDCEVVKLHRMEARNVMTLYEVREPLPKDMRLHSCLNERH